MTGLALILLIVAFLMKKFEKIETIKFLKYSFILGVIHFGSLILLSTIFGTESLKNYATQLLYAEFFFKSISLYLMYLAYNTLQKGEKGRGFVIAMMTITILDVVSTIVASIFI